MVVPRSFRMRLMISPVFPIKDIWTSRWIRSVKKAEPSSWGGRRVAKSSWNKGNRQLDMRLRIWKRGELPQIIILRSILQKSLSDHYFKNFNTCLL